MNEWSHATPSLNVLDRDSMLALKPSTKSASKNNRCPNLVPTLFRPKKDTAKCLILISNWWVMTGSNRRPSACKEDHL